MGKGRANRAAGIARPGDAAGANGSPWALVTDARLRMAVNVIRSLGRAGIPVVAAEEEGTERVIGYRSRYVRKRAAYSRHPGGRPDLSALLEAAGEGAVIIPILTDMVILLASGEEDLRKKKIKTLVPPARSIALAHNKESCLRLAREQGVPVPGTHDPRAAGVDPESREEIQAWARGLSYPVIVKYRRGEDLGLSASARCAVCRDPRELVRAYCRMQSLQAGPVVQDYLPGEDYGVALLYDGASQPVATFTYRSLRQRPRAAGPTTYAESVTCPELPEYAGRLLAPLKWKGLAMLDFRRTPDGAFHLLEVNPRFWGSLALAPLAGVDFPLLYYRAALGEEFARPVQLDGVRVRFFPHDFLSAWEYAGEDGRVGGARRVGRFTRSAVELLNPFLPDGLFSWSDPGPWLGYLAGALGKEREHGL